MWGTVYPTVVVEVKERKKMDMHSLMIVYFSLVLSWVACMTKIVTTVIDHYKVNPTKSLAKEKVRAKSLAKEKVRVEKLTKRVENLQRENEEIRNSMPRRTLVVPIIKD